MKADFSGWATKNGLKCSDGRTIMPDAFIHQDQTQVPLVWQHNHKEPENVLGHAILENRPEGVYTYAFFNNTPKGQVARGLVEHGDINQLSIWANQLIERGSNVLRGAIREVSLVLSGANPGAVIENVTLRHSDGDDTVLDDEAIIYTGIELVHADGGFDDDDETEFDDDDGELEHSTGNETVQDVYDSLTEEELTVLHYMIGVAVDPSSGNDAAVQHAGTDTGATIRDVYEALTPMKKDLFHFLIGTAVEEAQASAQHSTFTQETPTITTNTLEGTNTMSKNVFEQGDKAKRTVLSHDQMKEIVSDATKVGGSLKKAVEEYALAHGIEDIDVLFPEARSISDVPEFVKRRTEWVGNLLGSTRKSPFSRIKTISADLTFDEARAKGYVKGTLKKEEFFGVTKRVTTPTTIYKKQKLERDDMIDITDFDVVAWLKAEMRIMLEEELARAILIGDGRDIAHEDKINEGNIRPIATDHELYTTTVYVNIDDTASSVTEIIDALILNRRFYKGTGLPTFYTTETYIAKFLLLKDSTGRRIYSSLQELANELRVNSIVSVECMEDETDLVGVIVNPIDYVVGSDKGGDVNMFDDFDIDYNQFKYLLETRVSGCLVKVKSAIVIRKVASTLVLASPAEPTWDDELGEITITDTTGVVYKTGAGVTINNAGSPYTATPGVPYVVNATPATGYYFSSSEGDSWVYTIQA